MTGMSYKELFFSHGKVQYCFVKDMFVWTMEKSRFKEVIKMGHRETDDWLSGISNYQKFINSRRPDNRFGVVSNWRKTFIVVFAVLAVSLLLALFIDPLYLVWYEYKHAERARIFAPLTILGDSSWILLLCGSALLIISFFRSKRFQGATYVAWHRIILSFYFIFTSVAISGLIAVFFKNMIGKARPQFAMYSEGIHLWTFMPFADKYDFASFPSGHATTAGTMIVACICLFPRWGWLMVLLALWVAISRTAIGVHYPSDVFAGLMLGGFFTWLHARIFARKRLLFAFDAKGKLCLRGN